MLCSRVEISSKWRGIETLKCMLNKNSNANYFCFGPWIGCRNVKFNLHTSRPFIPSLGEKPEKNKERTEVYKLTSATEAKRVMRFLSSSVKDPILEMKLDCFTTSVPSPLKAGRSNSIMAALRSFAVVLKKQTSTQQLQKFEMQKQNFPWHTRIYPYQPSRNFYLLIVQWCWNVLIYQKSSIHYE